MLAVVAVPLCIQQACNLGAGMLMTKARSASNSAWRRAWGDDAGTHEALAREHLRRAREGRGARARLPGLKDPSE